VGKSSLIKVGTAAAAVLTWLSEVVTDDGAALAAQPCQWWQLLFMPLTANLKQARGD
jgi:hypothetical protein